MARDSATRLGRLGFRRWYERQLVESHAYLVTAFLCLIVLLAVLEQMDFRAGAASAVGLAVAAALVCALAVRRYFDLLFRAEEVAAQSTCEGCGRRGAYDVESAGSATDAAPEAAPEGGRWLRVRCRKCGHRWVIE